MTWMPLQKIFHGILMMEFPRFSFVFGLLPQPLLEILNFFRMQRSSAGLCGLMLKQADCHVYKVLMNMMSFII